MCRKSKMLPSCPYTQKYPQPVDKVVDILAQTGYMFILGRMGSYLYLSNHNVWILLVPPVLYYIR